jgi:Tfp pilus assembly protein FimT
MRLGQKGSTLPEAVVTLALAGVVMAIGAVGLRANYLDLSTAQQNLVNNVRRARMMATRKGVHYRVTFGSGSYQIERMKESELAAGVWQVDEVVEPESVELPASLSLGVASDSGGSSIEFDTRGMVVPPAVATTSSIVTVTLSEGDDEKVVRIWPSGQIERTANQEMTS